MSLRLQSGDWEAELRPEIGGCLARLSRGGVDVLRSMPEDSRNPLDSACFPLVPYCNRIRDGRFEWRGRDVRLPANFPPEPHSLHGFGWQAPWETLQAAADTCTLAHSHDGSGGWPWPYAAQQEVRLGPEGCSITLTLTNLADEPMPCGLGLHPYPRRRAGTRVSFAASQRLEADGSLIPSGATTPAGQWSHGCGLPGATIDHCFADWNGLARAEDDLGTVTIEARGARFLHLYAPEDGKALCLEPVSHQPDALNTAADQMIVLPPGCMASLAMRVSA